ncbi:MAG: hypothetical protein PUG67_08500 [Peptoniphilaceae bacterium]|nr:hypothetical protein [Peptoniphilaceae bacterium]MDY6018653.1 hypothetical protein [Anaerococcus sp.]
MSLNLNKKQFNKKMSDQIVEENQNWKMLEDFINSNGVGDLKDIKYIYKKDDTVKNGDHIGVVRQNWDSFINDQLTIRLLVNGSKGVCLIHKYNDIYGGVIIFGYEGFNVYRVSKLEFIKVV